MRKPLTLVAHALLGALALSPASRAFAEPAAEAAPVAPPSSDEAATPPAAPVKAGPDVSALRSELASVLDELAQARARASVLVKALFRTRVEVWAARRADDQRLVKVALKLDGIPVHDSDGAGLARGEVKLWDGYAAPGVHELTMLVREEARDNATYTYTREERYRFEIKKNTTTRIELVMRDDSDMATELPSDDEGEYDVRTTVRIERKAPDEK